ncbi:pancreatic lipase-related protein 2-like [Amblyraja radiata]|uniref:pancreatic lipase-related protein 2-like n=1 Tax=Amblyraja radiata TaxID=386614 RepID=UPI001403E8B7|nr:pancreatic lipase-related protein 2-like [Amblyraja radiata]
MWSGCLAFSQYSCGTSHTAAPAPMGGDIRSSGEQHTHARHSTQTKMLRLWIPVALLLSRICAEDEPICFQRLGCFPVGYPWTGIQERPTTRAPLSPDEIAARFLLYTRRNPDNFQEISGISPQTVAVSNFNTQHRTVLVIHGYLENGDSQWTVDLCKSILQAHDVNCVGVDWRGGSQCVFSQAAQNVRVVGAEIVYFLEALQSNYNYTVSDVYLVGHGLGAHAAGEAGRRKTGIARITGLDPVAPYFQNTPLEVRLDPTDALLVDVIHTDGSIQSPSKGYGMTFPCGHVDFYPNGGENMPGCSKNLLSTILDMDGIWEGTMNFLNCNHLRAVKYFTESVGSPDGFVAFPCASEKKFQAGECFACPAGGCPSMGYDMGVYRPDPWLLHQTFYLNTGESSPYALWRYNVSVKLSGSHSVSGRINIALYGTKGISRQHLVTKTKLHPGTTYTSLLDMELDVGNVTKVKFLWDNSVVNIFRPQLGADSITVERGRDQARFHFCGKQMVAEGTLQTLMPCAQ